MPALIAGLFFLRCADMATRLCPCSTHLTQSRIQLVWNGSPPTGYNMMESFAALFEASELNLNIEKGAVIQGIVVNIDSDWVTVDTGLKSEGIVQRAEFLNDQRELEVAVGDTVDVVVEALDNGMGQTVLSREKAKRAETWTKLEKIFEDGEIVTGIISGKVKGGSLLTSALFAHSCRVHW